MSNLKRIASLLVIAVFLLQFTAVAAAPMPQDVIGTQYEEAVGLLSALDIMTGDGTSFNPENDITRGEYAKILMKTMRLDDAISAFTPAGLFTDVPATNQFASAIELGVGAGAIKGYGDGTFGPDDKVTGMQAIKLMTYATNHNIKAEQQGGYPAGYRMIASDIGLLKGVGNIELDQPLNRGTAAIITFNALKTDMLKLVSIGVENTYKQIPGESLLTNKHNVFRFSGLVTKNDVTGLWGESTMRKNTVELTSTAQKTFFTGSSDISGAIGKYVRAYYLSDPDTEDETILSYEVLDNKNQIVTVDFHDIDWANSTTKKVYYWEDKENDTRTKYLNVIGAPAVICNGAAVSVNFAMDNVDAGSITFIDNDGDGIMDIKYMTLYENYVVKSIDTEGHVIYDKYGYASGLKSVEMDYDDPNVFVNITDVDGNEIEFDDIAIGNVVSIAKSDESNARRAYKLIVSDEEVSGVVDEVISNSGEYKLLVDGEEYELAANYANAMTSYGANPLKVNPGDEHTFYLDAFGRIAASKASLTTNANFGLIVDYALPTNSLYDNMKVKMYIDGAFADYTLSDKIKLDGRSDYKTAAEIETALKAGIDKAAVYPTEATSKVVPVLFKDNGEGVITYLDTPSRGTKENVDTLHLKGDNNKFAKYGYNSTTQILGGSHPLLPSAKIITVPSVLKDVKVLKNLQLQKGSDLKTSVSTSDTYNMQLYLTDSEGYKVEFALLQTAASGGWPTGSPNHDLQMMLVSGTTICLNDEGLETIKVYGYIDGAKKEVIVDADYYTDDSANGLFANIFTESTAGKGLTASSKRKQGVILPGDVIRYITNSHGAMSKARALFLYDEKVFRNDTEADAAVEYRAFHFGMINDIKDSTTIFLQKYNGDASAVANTNSSDIIVAADADGNVKQPAWDINTCRLFTSTGFKILVFDPNKPDGNQVTTGKATDLRAKASSASPSLVLMQMRSGAPKTLVIFKY